MIYDNQEVCIVTGANSGIGKETALSIASMNRTVVMICRNKERGESARREIIDQSGNDSVHLLIADLSSMNQVQRLAAEFKSQFNRLDILINNAGAMFDRRHVTEEGYERTFALNFLAPVLLTYELLDMLKASAPSRILNVSSELESRGTIDFANLQSERKFSRLGTYGSSKLMLNMFTYELADFLKHTGVTVNALTPGFTRSNFGRQGTKLSTRLFLALTSPFQKSIRKAAETSIYLATSPDVEGVSGKFFLDSKEIESSTESYDTQIRRQLMTETEQILGISFNA